MAMRRDDPFVCALIGPPEREQTGPVDMDLGPRGLPTSEPRWMAEHRRDLARQRGDLTLTRDGLIGGGEPLGNGWRRIR